MNKIKNNGPILIIIAAVLWALDGVIRRHLYSLPPITIIFFEHIIGLAILFPFVWKDIFNKKMNTLGVREWCLLMLVAFLSGLLGTLFFTTALLKVHFISFSVVFLLQKLQPLFAISTASIFLKERFNKDYILFAILAIISAYFVTFPHGLPNMQTGEGTLIAAMYALLAAVSWGSSTTFSKMILNKVESSLSTFYRFLFTSVFAILAIFIFGYTASLSLPTIPQFGYLGLIAISTGMVALMIYYKGLSKTPVHVSTILELVFPFIAIFIDMFLYKTILNPVQIIFAFVLCFAMYKISQVQNHSRQGLAKV